MVHSNPKPERIPNISRKKHWAMRRILL